MRQSAQASLDAIVVDSSTDDTPAIVAKRYPEVRLMHLTEPLSVPRLRGCGIAAARGRVIAILDPFSVAAPDLSVQVVAAHERHGDAVIGGSVDLYQAEAASYWRWSTYLNEYGLFMSPVIEGPAWILPGSNLSYKRAALFDGAEPRYPTFWKTFVNWELERLGTAIRLEPRIRIDLNKPIAFGDFLRTRYAHGRCFAALRVRDASALVRIARTASAALVPFLQLWRWSAVFWPKRSRRLRFIATLPAQLALFAMAAWGEACGYLRGSGRSCDNIYY
jgi:glycosyltransferase involved in cell wall biosynthesis